MTTAIESKPGQMAEINPYVIRSMDELGRITGKCKNCDKRITGIPANRLFDAEEQDFIWKHNSTQMLSCFPFGPDQAHPYLAEESGTLDGKED